MHSPEPNAQTHSALHTQNQRKGGAVWPPADCVYIKTLLAEWAYSMPFQTSGERNQWLPRYLAIYNGRRCHMALAGQTPIQQLRLLRATE